MIDRVIVRRGAYHDPFTLMQVSEEARSRDGVTHAAVGMGEPLNLQIIASRHGYDLSAEDGLGRSDLVIAVRAETKEDADRAVAAIEERLTEHGRGREVADVGTYVFAPDREPVADGASRQAGTSAVLDDLAGDTDASIGQTTQPSPACRKPSRSSSASARRGISPGDDHAHVPARRPPDRMGRHVGPDARRDHRRGAARGACRRPGRRGPAGRGR